MSEKQIKKVKIKVGGKDVRSVPTGTMKATKEYTVPEHVANYFIKRKEATKA